MGKTFRIGNTEYIKANRKGSREAELLNSNGFNSNHRIHKSEKTFSRQNEKKFLRSLEY